MATASDYNTAWSTLNNVPLNTKWDANGQSAYIKQLTAANPTQYKTPDMATWGQTTPTTTTAPTGLMTPTSTSTPTSTTGAYSFEDQARERYGMTAPTTSSPAVSSAPSYADTLATKTANHEQFAGQPDNSTYTLANQQRNSPVSQTATNFTGSEPQGTGTGPNGTYTFDDQARDRYGAANVNSWSANMANATPDLGAPSPWANPQAAQDEIDRRLALRGLPPQSQSTGAPGAPPTTPGLMGKNTVDEVGGKVGYEARQLANPTKWNVDDDQTVAGQVRNLLNENNPIQQQAATRAKQGMNERGLTNSSMAVQAGQAAMYDAAMPIATADAATFGRAAAYNADTENQFAGKNVDASNTAFNATANIRANTARDTAQTIAQANLADKQGNINAEAAKNLAGVNASTAAKLAETNTAAAVLKAQNDISVAARGALNDQALARLNGSIKKAGVGQEQSLLLLQDMTKEMNGIQASKDYDAETKAAKINELYERTNTSLRLFERASGLTEGLLRFEKNEPAPAPNTNTDGSPLEKNPDGTLKPRIAGKNGNPAATQSNFDSTAYFKAYPDVANYYASQPGGATPAQAWAHYNAAGMGEGRSAFLKSNGSTTPPSSTTSPPPSGGWVPPPPKTGLVG